MALYHVGLVGYTSKALKYGPCVRRGSHSFTCHPSWPHFSWLTLYTKM